VSRYAGSVADLLRGVKAGEPRAIARAITLIDEEGEAAGQLLDGLLRLQDPLQSTTRVIGLTGAPGAGKSSLSDLLIVHYRSQGLRVAVIAVDPSSPFTGGAVLGDRVRMGRHALDAGVFIRSLGARGALGGLAKPTRGAVRVLTAARYDVILIETVGVGQSELDVMYAADTVAVVLTPAGGDQVQATKSGIMEIADVYVINKADLPGAAKLAYAIAGMLDVRSPYQADGEGGWRPPIVQVSATTENGMESMLAALVAHSEFLGEEDRLQKRRARQCLQEIRERLREALWSAVDDNLGRNPAASAILQAAARGELTVERAVAKLLELWQLQ